MVIIEISQEVEKKLFICKHIITEICQGVEVRLKMQTEGLNFFKGAKVPESKIYEQIPKSHMKVRVDFF